MSGLVGSHDRRGVEKILEADGELPADLPDMHEPSPVAAAGRGRRWR
jgi:hypothetical protein